MDLKGSLASRSAREPHEARRDLTVPSKLGRRREGLRGQSKTIPNAKELVSLRIDRDILDHFQEAGPGWQGRINEALRKVVGK
jgi:uncharacterized protein (DUF4415 family)